MNKHAGSNFNEFFLKSIEEQAQLLEEAIEVIKFYADAKRYLLVDEENVRVTGILEQFPGQKARDFIAKVGK